METILHADNRLNHEEMSLVERGDFIFKEEEKGFRSGLSLSARWSEGGRDAALHQLYIERNRGELLFRGGRFEHADGSGFYTLDGLYLEKRADSVRVAFYGGIPHRIEDFNASGGHSTAGVDVHFTGAGAESETDGWRFLEGHIGYQFFQADGTEQKVTWSIAGRGGEMEEGVKGARIITAGSYLLDADLLENLLLMMEGKMEERTLLRLSYEIYEPESEPLSFRGRFYSLYAGGREVTVRGAVHYAPSEGIDLYGKGRRVTHNSGASGYGGTLGAAVRTPHDLTLTVEVDYLYLNKENALACLLSSRKSLGAETILSVGGIYRIHNKRTTGKNRSMGLEAEVERMLKGDLFLSIYAMRIWNSRMDDELRSGARVAWHFNRGS